MECFLNAQIWEDLLGCDTIAGAELILQCVLLRGPIDLAQMVDTDVCYFLCCQYWLTRDRRLLLSNCWVRTELTVFLLQSDKLFALLAK